MALHFKYLLIILTLWVQTLLAATSPRAYWQQSLPNTPMPSILDVMSPKTTAFDLKKERAKFNGLATMALYSWYNYDIETPKPQLNEEVLTTIFIRPEDVKPGHKVEIKYMGASNLGPDFMRRDQVDKTLPFSSKNLPRILAAFNIKQDSDEAEKMSATLRRCEGKREEHRCVSSLESMVDYVTSEMGTSVKPLSVNVIPSMETKKRYTIVNVERLGEKKKVISCHKASFPYGVFYCHPLGKSTMYHVELDGGNNLKVDTALVICHHDTASWHPKYVGFKILNLKHGQPMCHFLHADNVVWLSNNVA